MVDQEYVAIARSWREHYLTLIQGAKYSQLGERAIQAVAESLPCDVYVFSGLLLPELANTGGLGAGGYDVVGLKNIHRNLFNRLELIAVSRDLSWSCVFSHEAGAFVAGSLYEYVA